MEQLIAHGLHPDQVAAVFLTHPHGDHTDGLVQFVDLVNWYFKNANPAIFLPNNKLLEGLTLWLEGCCDPFYRELDFRVVTPGLLYDDGTVRVTSYPTKHCPNSSAYLVECEGKTVLFTGDLLYPSVDYPEDAKKRPLDLVVCEASHFSPREYLPIWEESDVKCVVHAHILPRRIAELEEIKNEPHPYRYLISHDDMVLEL